MRQVKIGSSNYTQIHATDEAKYNANHVYIIEPVDEFKSIRKCPKGNMGS